MKDLKDMLSPKKVDAKMSERDIKVKSDILKEIMQFAQDKMGESVKSGMDEMQKVSVMAPDSEGLHEGLEKAMEILPEHEEMESSENEEPKDEIAEILATTEEDPAPEKKDEDSYYTSSHNSVANDDDEDSMFNKKMKMLKK